MKNILNHVKQFSNTYAGQLIINSMVSIAVSLITYKIINKSKGE